MSLQAGPFLKFCGGSASEWIVSVLVITDRETAPVLTASIGTKSIPTTATRIHGFQKSVFWTFRLLINRTATQQTVVYKVTDDSDVASFDFHVPAQNAIPAMAYASCAGFHSAKAAQNYGAQKNERWQHLLSLHRQFAEPPQPGAQPADETAYHLLLMGGDQVYADAIWTDQETSSIVRWNDDGQSRKAKFTSLMATQVERFYLKLYLSRWKQSSPAEVYASIPSIMMWDDHDIFDGWGSYEPELQYCPVHQGIFRIAAQYFRLFQHHSASLSQVPGLVTAATPTPIPGVITVPTKNDENHTVGFSLGPLAIVAPDLRGSRTSDQILGRTHMDAIVNWLESLGTLPAKPRHLIVMLSIPLMYPSFQWIESVLGLLPGSQDLEDDLRDHWTSRPHREERLRLIHRLLKFAREQNCRITIVSGDVHVAAVSTITADGLTDSRNVNVMNQFISSAIVNSPPPATAMFFLNHVANWKEDIDRNIVGEMKTYPNTSTTFIAKRNWLSLQPDSQHRIWANLHVEGEEHPYVKVIHPGDSI
ncbi:MAG: alkaline phosphatase family protein [Planctomycetaceae bacterium]|nr:alkaline phosphatase family protein [Planctomycetaceae bacterium]